ncbi:MAG: hypothetical protein HPY53_14205 [Brevinematales bacterium]|nr:hypothetical protein [Brevinematales bacterium]
MSIQLAYALFRKVRSGKLKIEVYVEIENLGFEKHICVKNPRTGASYCEAVYAGFVGNNQECWQASFEIDGDSLGEGLPFSVEYSIGGKTFVDDNNGNSYLIVPDMPEIIIRSGMLFLIDAAVDGASFSGRIGVKRTGEICDVKVLFSTDKWQTFHEAPARLDRDLPDIYGVSIYTFSAKLKELKKADALHFYLSCVVGGETYWGNNFSRDYIIRIKQ